MITEEEISHQNNNFFDLSHPNVHSTYVSKEPHQPPPAAHNEPPAARPRHRGQAGEVGVAGVTGHQATLVLCRPELCFNE